MKTRGPIYLGMLLFACYLLQYAVPSLRPNMLVAYQQQETYKIITGSALALLVGYQWYLSKHRFSDSFNFSHDMVFLRRHKWLGALMPLCFFIHSASPGYGYQLGFSAIFFLNFLLGLLNPMDMKIGLEKRYSAWLMIHVAMSVSVTLLVLYHIGVVFYYK